jgi:hypothetical protein
VADQLSPDAADRALAFLETDAFVFRSGYERNRVARMLAHAHLDEAQRARARAIAIGCVDGRLHTPHPGAGRLAGAVANNELRVALRARLHARDAAVASRALRTVVWVRHPGLTPPDVRAAREIVLREMREAPYRFAASAHVRLAMRLWDPEWEVELRADAQIHGPDRAAARALLAVVERRRARRAERERPGP